MRNKIKQLMNKEEGFTLVELLAVIVILGIILAIAIPAIGNVITNAGTKANTAQDALVEDAARLYFVENPKEEKVTVLQLKTGGFISERESSDMVESLEDTTEITKASLTEITTPTGGETGG